MFYKKTLVLLTVSIVFFESFFLSSKKVTFAQASQIPPLAVEAIHFDDNGSVRNVNGFYVTDTVHFVPSVFNHFTAGSNTYDHSLVILNVSDQISESKVSYYDASGKILEKSHSIPGKGFIVVGWGLGLPNQYSGSAVVETSQNSVVESTIKDNVGYHRGYRAIPLKKVAKKIYIPIVYDRVFPENGLYESTSSIQNPNDFTIPAGGIRLKMTCKDASNSYIVSNESPVLPKTTVTLRHKVPDDLLHNITLPSGQVVSSFCNYGAEDINAVLFGHGEVESDYLIAGIEVIANSTSGSQRSEELKPNLSNLLYIPSVALGSWNNNNISTSLNIANPNNATATVYISTYRLMEGIYRLDEIASGYPQAPGKYGCMRELTSPIPEKGEKSFFFNKKKADDSCDWSDSWGADNNAFGFAIVNSSQPVAVSYNKTRVDDFAENALPIEDISSTLYVPQVFVNYAPPLGNFHTKVNILNPSDFDYVYLLQFYNASGALINSFTANIKSKSLYLPDTSNLPSDNAYSLKISPNEPSPTPSCPLAKQGDVNCDNNVNILDLVTVLSNFGRLGTGVAGDINGDGTVNILDLVTLLGNFGRSS